MMWINRREKFFSRRGWDFFGKRWEGQTMVPSGMAPPLPQAYLGHLVLPPALLKVTLYFESSQRRICGGWDPHGMALAHAAACWKLLKSRHTEDNTPCYTNSNSSSARCDSLRHSPSGLVERPDSSAACLEGASGALLALFFLLYLDRCGLTLWSSSTSSQGRYRARRCQDLFLFDLES